MKTRHYLLAIFFAAFLLIGGLNKVSYELYQALELQKPLAVEIGLGEGKIELYLFDQTKVIDLNYIAETYRERLQSILSWNN
ncbi:hypothetical protein [Desulfitibacter alkalitolerans]|uniref:hypothetical protein n=1 Tax=Desulfitibacter alkalitolerans TaxID=264641 RepID=UPI0012EC1CAF|nr:hypothetical protein [Desulfitibacter alkalitolerans]